MNPRQAMDADPLLPGDAVVGGPCPNPAITDPGDPAFDPDCVSIDPLPGVHIDKVIVGDDDTELQPGATFDYVVTVENIGKVDLADETFTDDPTDVVDDDTLDPGSIRADVGTATFAGLEITWVDIWPGATSRSWRTPSPSTNPSRTTARSSRRWSGPLLELRPARPRRPGLLRGDTAARRGRGQGAGGAGVSPARGRR